MKRPFVKALLATIVVVGLGAPLSAQQPLRGFLALDGERVVAERNADHLFVPASVQKLAVAAAALHHLGPDYRIETPLIASGVLRQGVLEGDLLVSAMADPSWSRRWRDDNPLTALAPALRQRGVVRVTGDLVILTGRFPGPAAPLDRPLSEVAFAFAAPASALAVEENRLEVEIAPGERPGEAGRVSGPSAYRLVNEMVTVGAERHGRGTVEFLPRWGEREVVIRGEYPVSEGSYEVALAEPAPVERAGEALRRALEEGGIVLEGDVRLSPRRPAPSAEPLAVLASPPLSRLLEPVLRDSHNWYADMLLRHLAAVRGDGRLETGPAVLDEFWREVVRAPNGSAVGFDGSGLARVNLVTPRAVAALLSHAARQPWFEAFRDALAEPGVGTLEAWRGPSVAAKTGTLRHTHGLAGYLRRAGRRPVVFVYFLNHHRAGKAAAWREMATALAEWQKSDAARGPR